MNEEVTLVFGGDFCPTQHVEQSVDEGRSAVDMLGPIVDKFQQSDFAIVNLEYPLTQSSAPLNKCGSHQKGHPKTITVLKELGVDLVTLANNHILDYGEQGLKDTLGIFQNVNIETVGAGMSQEEARKPFCIKLKGRSFAFVGVCENEFSVSRFGRGGAYGLDLIYINKQIRRLKEDHDFLIVLFHGGSEFTHYPSPETIRTCHYLIECGASAVVCHHPHYIQGIEYYRDAPVLYSLGKLFYTKMADADILEVPVATFKVPVKEGKICVDFEFYRLSLKRMCLVSLSPAEKLAIEKRFQDYSSAISSPERIEAEWDKYCERRKMIYLSIMLGIPSWVMRILRGLHLRGIMRYYASMKRKELLAIENCVRCEAHREAILNILEE
jgi:hypothetical protein